MGRIRSIKPEFPQSETIGRLSRDARLLFIQLWTIVDDQGRTRAASRMLASLLYPYDDDAPKLIGKWLDELERAGCIRRYVVAGSHYLDVPTWGDHQKIDRPSKSKLPPFDEGSRVVANAREGSSTDMEGDQEGERDKDHSRSVAKATRPATDKFFEEFWASYPKRGEAPNPKAPARKAFDAAVNAGADPGAIIAAIKARVGIDKERIGTRFIPRATTWLHERCWQDREQTGPPQAERKPVGWQPGMPTHEELLNKYRDDNGRNQESDGGGLLQAGSGVHREVA